MFEDFERDKGDFVYFGTGKPYEINVDNSDFSKGHIEYKYGENGKPCALVGAARFCGQKSKKQYCIPTEATRGVIDLLEHCFRHKDVFDEDNDLAEQAMLPFVKSLGDVTGREYTDAPMKQQLRWFHRNVLSALSGNILVIGDVNARALNWNLKNITVVTDIKPDVKGNTVSYSSVQWKKYDIVYIMHKSELPDTLDAIYVKALGRMVVNPNLDFNSLLRDTSGFMAIGAVTPTYFGKSFDVIVSKSDYVCHCYNDNTYGSRYEGTHYLELIKGTSVVSSRYYTVWVLSPPLHLETVSSSIPIIPIVPGEVDEYTVSGSVVASLPGEEEVIIRIEEQQYTVHSVNNVIIGRGKVKNPGHEWIVCQGLVRNDGRFTIVEVLDSSLTGACSFAERWDLWTRTRVLLPKELEKAEWSSMSEAMEIYDDSPHGILISKYDSSPGEVPDLTNGLMFGKMRKIVKKKRVRLRLYEGDDGRKYPGDYFVNWDDYLKGVITIVSPSDDHDNSYVVQRLRNQATIEQLMDSYRQDHVFKMLAVVRNSIGKGFILGRFDGSTSFFHGAPDIDNEVGQEDGYDYG